MRGTLMIASVLLTPLATALAQTKQPAVDPAFIGVITRITSPTEFSVEGVPVLLQPSIQPRDASGNSTLWVGQTVNLWGKAEANGTIFSASQVLLLAPAAQHVRGTGLVDHLEDSPAGAHRFRADGRILEISDALLRSTPPPKQTAVARPADAVTPIIPEQPAPAPSATPDDIHTNIWVDYTGTQRPDGIVQVEQAGFADNQVSKAESKLQAGQKWDPAAVDEDAHQSLASRVWRGTDLKQIAPYKDPEQQARLDRIGNRLIPAFQRSLPDSDPVKIHFRFQLVDEPRWHDAVTTSTGNILVPYQIAERLQNDSQLAAVLADNIATALEKQQYRQQSTRTTLAVVNGAGGAILLASPVTGAAAILATMGAGKVMQTHAEQQSGRVALCLMHDAGYDIREAPEAWWTLSARQDTDPHRKAPPARAANQYQALGTTWQSARQQPERVAEAKP